MSESFEIDPVDRFTAGAVGEPGERIFFVQADGAGRQLTLLAEKEQVRLLGEAAQTLLSQIPETNDEGAIPPPSMLELSEPPLPEWRIGEMSLEFDEARDRITVILVEIVGVSEEGEPLIDDPATARFVITRAQARAMAEHALEVVAAGRPRCQLCGSVMEPGGEHMCPSRNGHSAPR